MTRIYRYILTHDHGMAPCPEGGVITLGTCKPMIRRKAAPGDWVPGFRPGSLERGLVLWAGRVERIMAHGDFERQYRGRTDAQYLEAPDGSYERKDPSYHRTEREKERDLSGPVLIFDPVVSRYFHGRPVALPPGLGHLAAAGRGHRVNDVKDGDAARIEAWIGAMPHGPDDSPVRSRRTCRKC